MTKGWIYIGALLTATAALVSKGYGYYKQLRYKLNKAYLSEVTPNNVELTLEILIKNPTSVSISIKEVKGDVYLNSKRVGYIKTKIIQTLKADSVSVIKVPVILNAYATSGNIVGNLLRGNEFENYTLLAKTAITVANIPVKVNFTYKLSDIL